MLFDYYLARSCHEERLLIIRKLDKSIIFENLNKCYASIMEISLKRTEAFHVLQRKLALFEIRNEPWQQNCHDHNAKAKSYGESLFIEAI